MTDPLDHQAHEAAGGRRIFAGVAFLVAALVIALVVMTVRLAGH